MRTDGKIENKRLSTDRRRSTSSDLQQGSNKGRGPRSYVRNDNRILDQINERFCDNPYLDASEMEVAVDDGVVTLAGVVNSRDEKL